MLFHSIQIELHTIPKKMIAMTTPKFAPLALLAVVACMCCFDSSMVSAFSAGSVRIHTAPSGSRSSVIRLGAASEELSAAAEVAAEAAPADEEEEKLQKQQQQQQQKKPKKKKKQPAADQEPLVIDVSKLDIRVGLIEKCWEHEEADKLYCEEINLGEEGGPRNIASGLKAHYTAEEMVGKKVLVLANLKSRKLVGFPSHGMVLCAAKYGEAEDGSEDTIEFVCPPDDAEIGDRVICDGCEGEPATENQVVKKKMLNAIFPDLKVNADGIAVYKDVPLTTTTGGFTCKAESLTDAPIS